MADHVLFAAALAQRPRRGGHASFVLNWLGGLRDSGHQVTFVDRIDPSLGDVERGVEWVAAVMGAAGFDWIVLTPDGGACGLSRRDLAARSHDGLLIDVMAYLGDRRELDGVARRVVLDIDPGFGQAWQHAGLATLFAGFDAYVTVGLNVGAPDCGVPTLGLSWTTTLPPVDLHRWRRAPVRPDGRLTTVASWRGPFAPVVVDGTTHGLRAHEARAFAAVPSTVPVEVEMALDIDPADAGDRALLVDGGWRLCAPDDVAHDPCSYQRYVAGSLGELAVAKQAYVTLRTGWFSDRSVCYLATGRPVIVSDTGLGERLPLGRGILTFDDPPGATAAIEAVLADPAGQSDAARRLAEELFDARRVAGDMVRRVA